MIAKALKSLAACIIGAVTGTLIHALLLSLLMPDVWQIWVDLYMMVRDQPEEVPPAPRRWLIIPVLFVFTICAMPAQALLQKLRLNGYASNVGLCVLAGMAGGYLMAGSFGMTISQSLLFFAPIAFFTGSIAWLIRRPDKEN